jgi:peptidoglycan/xylan/chitin deacetylase (PgdA/CDA1 family)
MKGWLTESQKQYILEHLGHHATLTQEILDAFCFDSQPPQPPSRILFHTTEDPLDPDTVLWIDEIPVLYPIREQPSAFYSLHGKNLVFHHDLLKSAFHLLSGYEECMHKSLDPYGRFPYKDSLPHKLGFIGRPVVNYYFEKLLDGIDAFCRANKIPFERNPVFRQPVFMLSHDIDLVKQYGFFGTGFQFKQLLGLAPATMSRKDHFIRAFEALFHFLNPFSGEDPYWNFERLMKWEEDHGFRGTYFFLEREGGRHDNSRYRFHWKKYRQLFRDLSSRGHEVGIHGTIQSATSQAYMDRTVQHLRDASPSPVEGIRQHYLKYSPGITGKIQQKAGLLYDASLGFAEQEGFRQSYCWPFRLYDFESDRSLEIWEIPLIVMDITLFNYRKLDARESRSAIENLLAEVLKFNGVFSLLWHNNMFDERENPGITELYTSILGLCKGHDMEGLTGRAIVNRMRFAN